MNSLKKAHSAESRIKTQKIKNMEATINYTMKAAHSMTGIDYDELLQLQAETGLSIRQLEFMYYNFKN